MEGFWKILSNLTIYFSLFYPLLYIKGFSKYNKAFKIFTIYLVCIGIIQISSQIAISIFKGSNLYLSHFYFISQFILLSFFYFQLLKYRWIFMITGLILGIVIFQFINDPGIFYRYNPLGMTITQGILVVYSLLYFYKSLSGKSEFLIVNVGVFFYMLSSALIFASGNLVFDANISESFTEVLIRSNLILFLVFQILIITEWWKNYS